MRASSCFRDHRAAHRQARAAHLCQARRNQARMGRVDACSSRQRCALLPTRNPGNARQQLQAQPSATQQFDFLVRCRTVLWDGARALRGRAGLVLPHAKSMLNCLEQRQVQQSHSGQIPQKLKPDRSETGDPLAGQLESNMLADRI